MNNNALLYWKEKHPYTDTELATRAGISRQSVSKHSKPGAEITDIQIPKYAKAFGVSEAEFLRCGEVESAGVESSGMVDSTDWPAMSVCPIGTVVHLFPDANYSGPPVNNAVVGILLSRDSKVCVFSDEPDWHDPDEFIGWRPIDKITSATGPWLKAPIESERTIAVQFDGTTYEAEILYKPKEEG